MQSWLGNKFKYESYWQQKPEEMQCLIYQLKKLTKSITVFWITAIKIS